MVINIYNILLIFLGSLLTFIATVLVELLKNDRQRKSKEKSFKLISSQELRSTVKNLEKLKTAFEYKNFFDYTVITSIDKNISALEALQHDSIYLNETSQASYIDLVSKLSSFASSVRGIQDLFYNQQRALANDKLNTSKIKRGTAKRESIFSTEKENFDVFQQNSIQKFIDLVEITRKLEELLKSLSR